MRSLDLRRRAVSVAGKVAAGEGEELVRRPGVSRVHACMVAVMGALLLAGSAGAAAAGPSTPPLLVTGTVDMALRPLPATRLPVTLSDVAFATPQQGLAVGSRCAGLPAGCRGVVLVTADGGATWHPAPELPTALTAVRFLGPGFAWAWGPSAAYISTDGGSRWRPLALPSRGGAPVTRGEPIQFVSFSTARQGWLAVGGVNCATQGCPLALYETRDGGTGWRLAADNTLPGAPGSARTALGWAEFTGGGYLGGGHGWLLSQTPAGAVWTTVDGGARWTAALGLQTGGATVAASLTPGGSGWAAGRVGSNRSSLFATVDGGRIWRHLADVPAVVWAVVPALDGRSAWALSGQATTTCAWGSTCARDVAVLSAASVAQLLPIPAGMTLHALSAFNSRTAWAVGTGHFAGYGLLQTTDGGHTWHLRYRTGQQTPGGAWGFWNGRDGWAVSSATSVDAVLMTSNGGQTWSRVGGVPVQSVSQAGFTGPDFGWVLSGQGRLLVTHDGGRRWSVVQRAGGLTSSLNCGFPQAIGFTAPSFGWQVSGGICAAGAADGLTVTVDGGRQWVGVAPPAVVRAAAFASPRVGWAVVQPAPGEGQLVLEETRDGGQAWEPIADLGPSIAWVDPLGVGAAPGARGLLWLYNTWRSLDGGRKWTRYVLPAAAGTASVHPLDFISRERGWLQVAGGLYQTVNGGQTWVEVCAAQ